MKAYIKLCASSFNGHLVDYWEKKEAKKEQ